MLAGFKAQNHPQQTGRRGARDEVNDRATHPDYFDPWNERFGVFTLDAAASPTNAKCERYFTIEDDGLAQSWAGERVWCNPPYTDLAAWVAKAWQEHEGTRGIVMLLPANRVEQSWWQDHIEPFRDRAGSPLHQPMSPPGATRDLPELRSTDRLDDHAQPRPEGSPPRPLQGVRTVTERMDAST